MSGTPPAAVLVVLRVVGTLVALGAVLTGSVGLAAGAARVQESTSWTETGVRVLRVEVPAGEVELRRGTGPVRVQVDRLGTFAVPAAGLSRRGASAALTTGCQGWHVVGRCRVDVVATVPPGVRVVVTGATADVSADSLAGGLTVQTSTGDVHVTDVTGDVRVATSVGDVDVVATSAPRLTVRTSAGDVDVELVTPPQAVDVRTSVGDVTLLVPADGTAYQVTTRRGLGEAVVDVPRDDSSPRTLDVETSVGDVLVGRTG